VLIVDDDPDIREVVAAMLEAVGLVVTAAGSAEEALDRVHLEAFDLLVLDWNLPKMTGLDLCRILRKEPDHASLPVLFLTANASSQDMVEAFACGGDDYVVKPFRAPELGARIFSLLRRARASLGQI
jgi:two-component system phosphate regulon response regulator PhoB